MAIEVSRQITGKVRGLHLAVITHNRTGKYHGNGMLIPTVVELAKRGAYTLARKALRDLRSNGRDRETFLHEMKHAYRFTHAAAQYLDLVKKSNRFTSKYVEVEMTRSEVSELRSHISKLRARSVIPTHNRMLDAALNVVAQ